MTAIDGIQLGQTIQVVGIPERFFPSPIIPFYGMGVRAVSIQRLYRLGQQLITDDQYKKATDLFGQRTAIVPDIIQMQSGKSFLF